jgi:PEP-CTERM motif
MGEGKAQGGKYDYFDDTYRQLVDGAYGVNNWKADLGNGPAFEWVGWREADPIITFQFGQAVTVREVSIDFNRSEKCDRIFLPKKVEINGSVFHLKQHAIADNTRGTVTFKGCWTGDRLCINLIDHNPTRWIFVDEIRCTGEGPTVPEPSAVALLILGLGFAALRYRRG